MGLLVYAMVDVPIGARKINQRNGYLSLGLGKGTQVYFRPDINITYQGFHTAAPVTVYGLGASLSF